MIKRDETLLPSVGIIGGGWLGKALAKQLCQRGCDVIATTTDNKNCAEIERSGATSEILVLPIVENLLPTPLVFGQKALVIAIPPQLKQEKLDYPDKIKQVVTLAEHSGVTKIILLSSTAIYNNLEGDIHEDSALDFSADKVSILAKAEKELLKFTGTGIILRLAGLVGPKRHPGRFLINVKQMTNGHMSVNLIHQKDVIGIINCCLAPNTPAGIYNGVSNTHVTKQVFYSCAAKALSFPEPLFQQQSVKQANKIVLGEKVKSMLGYQMQMDNLVEWLTPS